eukprot:6927035-Ditylum_brightwellii.AAC.1
MTGKPGGGQGAYVGTCKTTLCYWYSCMRHTYISPHPELVGQQRAGKIAQVTGRASNEVWVVALSIGTSSQEIDSLWGAPPKGGVSLNGVL